MRWRIKAFVQKILAVAPGGKSVYYFLQKKIGGFRNYSIVSKLSQGLRLISDLDSLGYHISEKNTFEIGTGWSPVIPMLFHILGQQACYTYDIERLLKAELSLKAARELANLGQNFENQIKKCGYKVNHERLLPLKYIDSLPKLLIELNINYYAPADACLTHLESSSIDVVFSNTVLGYIPRTVLSELFLEMRRILSKNGIMIHHVDCSDHYSHSDGYISRINFLKYSDQEWRKYNNAFLFQNRLRPNSYRRLAEDAGFDVTILDPCVSEEAMDNLHNISLDDKFLNMPPEEICTTSFVLIGKPKT